MISIIFICDRCSKEKHMGYPETKMDDLMYELRSCEVQNRYLCDECEKELKLLKEKCKQHRNDEIDRFFGGDSGASR